MAWPVNTTKFGPNRTPVLLGLSDQDEQTVVPLSADPTTGNLQVGATINVESIDIGAVSTVSAPVNTGQKTVSTSAVQITNTSTIPTNGIIIGGLSTNSASIFVGGASVSTSTGVEVPPGSQVSFTCNLNTLYIISATSTTDVIWYNVV